MCVYSVSLSLSLSLDWCANQLFNPYCSLDLPFSLTTIVSTTRVWLIDLLSAHECRRRTIPVNSLFYTLIYVAHFYDCQCYTVYRTKFCESCVNLQVEKTGFSQTVWRCGFSSGCAGNFDNHFSGGKLSKESFRGIHKW